MGGLGTLGHWVQTHQQTVLWGYGVLIMVVVALTIVRRIRTGSDGGLTTHGSARWATRREVQRLGLYGETGIIVGRLGPALLRDNSEAHVLLCGATRSGKGLSHILPTLLTWEGSALVLDPKDGENYDVTADWRRTVSHVYAFTPCREPHACLNILDTVRTEDLQAVGDAMLIAQSLVAPHKLSHESSAAQHYRELATMLLTAAILVVLELAERSSLAGVWNFLTEGKRSPAQALRDMMATPFLNADTEQAVHDLIRAVQSATSGQGIGGVWTTAMRPLMLFSDPLIAASTDTSTFEVDWLQYAPYPMTLYLIAPSPMALHRLHPLYRLILDVGLTRLMEHKVRTWKHRLLNVLDELPWHGYVRTLDQGIAVQAGYGQKNLVVTQDLPALLETFGQHTALMSNCDVKIWHRPANDETARRISQTQLGIGTVLTHGQSRTQRGWGETTQTTGRPLLTADEVLDLPQDQALVRVGGCKPILATKANYRTDAEFLGRWKEA